MCTRAGRNLRKTRTASPEKCGSFRGGLFKCAMETGCLMSDEYSVVRRSVALFVVGAFSSPPHGFRAHRGMNRCRKTVSVFVRGGSDLSAGDRF